MRTDYLLHFLASAAIMAALDYFIPASWAFFATVGIGVAKELIWDKWMKKGTPEYADLFFDFLGAFAMGVVSQIAPLLQ